MKREITGGLLAVVIVAAGVGWAISSITGGDTHATSTVAVRRVTKTSAHRRHGHRLPHGWSYIATVVRTAGRVNVYTGPTGHHVRLVLAGRSAIGVPLTLLVRHIGHGRVETYLPVRPNRSTGWVSRHRVRLLTTAYQLRVQLRTHRLLVLVAGKVIHRFTIGVGQSVTPTPSGTYFVTELLKQPDPSGPYGPYAFGLSAHSGVLQHFGQGGDGQIGIHGTDQPALIGTDVSHGCIRLRNSEVVWLVHRLPLGTPVTINRA